MSAPRRSRGFKTYYKVVIALAGTALAAALLYRTLSQTSFAQLSTALASMSWVRLAGALGFAAASYFCLTWFDWLATRYAEKPLPWRKAAQASFVSLSLGHNIGFAALSSGAIRYRFYSRWGLNAEEVAKIILFCGSTVGIGLALLAGFVLTAAPQSAAALGLSAQAARMFGAACLVACGVWLMCAIIIKRSLRLRQWSFRFPPARLALAQMVVGPLNFAFVAACLHQTLAAFSPVDYANVATAYVVANSASLIAHAPGGLGVIEAVVAHLVPGPNVVAALLAFRFTYFFAPLALGLAVFAKSEIMLQRKG